MKLTYQSLVRREVDPAIIATLLRKGWIEAPEDPPTPPSAPDFVENWQLEEELAERGALATLKAAVQALPNGAQRRMIEARYAKKNILRRNEQLVTFIGTALNLTSDQMDALFLAASART